MGKIVVSLDEHVGAALDAALDAFPWQPPRSPVALLLPTRPMSRVLREAAAVVDRRCRQAGAGAVRPTRPPAGLARLFRSAESVSVPLPAATSRFTEAVVPASLLTGSRVLIIGLTGADRRRGPLDSLAAFAAPRQVVAARFADGAAAELGAALGPALFVMVGTIEGVPVAVVTADPVAAELVWVAAVPPADESLVAWQTPNVQRASRIGLGAETPDDVTLVTAGSRADDCRSSLDALRRRIALPPDPNNVGRP